MRIDSEEMDPTMAHETMAHATGAPTEAPGRAPLRVALLGCGVVGSAVATRLVEHADDLAARVGAPLELVGIAVRRPQRPRPDVPVDPALFTADAEELVTRADIVIEVIGGIDPARGLILRAMEHGASVVSANKALLAEDGPALYAAADAADVDLYYEAAVAGAIPILRPIRESLAGDDVRKVLGIVNGTTNFVLDKMDTSGAGFAETVEQAQALGYAEADPTADVEGFDAAAKAAILASLAFHTRVSRQGDGLRRQAARDLPAGDQRRRFGCRERARPPGDDPAQPPARQRPGCLQRGVRRGHRCRAAHVLRPRRRGRPDGIRRPR